MTSFIPGQGLKKPLNMLENPEIPLIKKSAPTHIQTGKHWVVHENTMMHEENPFKLNDAVLVQKWDHNDYRNGKSAYEERIGDAVRFPIENYYEHHGPLNRIPATIHTKFIEVNPSTVSDGGTSGYIAQNGHEQLIDRQIYDDLKFYTSMTAGFHKEFDSPENYDEHADLSMKMPDFSATPGMNTIYRERVVNDLNVEDANKPSYSATTGMDGPYKITGRSDTENYEALNKTTSSISAGHSANVTKIDTNRQTTEISEKITTSLVSGHENSFKDYDNLQNNLRDQKLDPKLTTPITTFIGSESGYKERINRNDEKHHIKIKENPQVPSNAPPTYTSQYQRNEDRHSAKLKPTLSYESVDGNRNMGIMRKSRPEIPNIILKRNSMRKFL